MSTPHRGGEPGTARRHQPGHLDRPPQPHPAAARATHRSARLRTRPTDVQMSTLDPECTSGASGRAARTVHPTARHRPAPYPATHDAHRRRHPTLAGRSDILFSDDAVSLIHQTSRGLPRASNYLAARRSTRSHSRPNQHASHGPSNGESRIGEQGRTPALPLTDDHSTHPSTRDARTPQNPGSVIGMSRDDTHTRLVTPIVVSMERDGTSPEYDRFEACGSLGGAVPCWPSASSPSSAQQPYRPTPAPGRGPW